MLSVFGISARDSTHHSPRNDTVHQVRHNTWRLVPNEVRIRLQKVGDHAYGDTHQKALLHVHRRHIADQPKEQGRHDEGNDITSHQRHNHVRMVHRLVIQKAPWLALQGFHGGFPSFGRVRWAWLPEHVLSWLEAGGGDGVEDFGLFWGVLLCVRVQVERCVRQELPEEEDGPSEEGVDEVLFHGV